MNIRYIFILIIILFIYKYGVSYESFSFNNDTGKTIKCDNKKILTGMAFTVELNQNFSPNEKEKVDILGIKKYTCADAGGITGETSVDVNIGSKKNIDVGKIESNNTDGYNSQDFKYKNVVLKNCDNDKTIKNISIKTQGDKISSIIANCQDDKVNDKPDNTTGVTVAVSKNPIESNNTTGVAVSKNSLESNNTKDNQATEAKSSSADNYMIYIGIFVVLLLSCGCSSLLATIMILRK